MPWPEALPIPFATLSAWQLVFLFTVYLGAFFIRGCIGFGSVTPTVLGGALVLPPHHAVLLILCTNVVSQIQLLGQGIRDGDWQVAKPLILTSMVTLAIGTWLFVATPGPWLTVVLGVSLGIVLLLDAGQGLDRLKAMVDFRSPKVAIALAAVAGVLGGLAGAGAAFLLAVYVKLACPEPRRFRGTNLLLTASFVFWRIILVLIAGLITLPLLLEAAVLAPVTVLGTWLGSRYSETIPTQQFFRIVQAVLLLASLALVGKGLSQLL